MRAVVIACVVVSKQLTFNNVPITSRSRSRHLRNLLSLYSCQSSVLQRLHVISGTFGHVAEWRWGGQLAAGMESSVS